MGDERHAGPVVCIVDDDDAIRRALQRLVESLGLQALAFASPQELLDQCPAVDPDCLLLDVQLPGMTGFELYDAYRDSGLQPPVIFITGEPRPDTRSRAEQVNAVACLEKPFDEASLLHALDAALGRDSSAGS
jgi:FixJ family two-component response regulator